MGGNRTFAEFGLNGHDGPHRGVYVDCIEKWWRTDKRHAEAKILQILADGGGSNSCTLRAWKHNLQHRLGNWHGLP